MKGKPQALLDGAVVQPTSTKLGHVATLLCSIVGLISHGASDSVREDERNKVLATLWREQQQPQPQQHSNSSDSDGNGGNNCKGNSGCTHHASGLPDTSTHFADENAAVSNVPEPLANLYPHMPCMPAHIRDRPRAGHDTSLIQRVRCTAGQAS